MTSETAWSLKTNLRKLWADHVIWTREYLVAAIAATQDAQAAAGRLLKNQEHLGNAIVPYYGQVASEKLTDLLKQHILIAVDLVAAAKAGQQEQFQEQDQGWTQNAKDIATFLAGANPNWPAQDIADLLNLHLELTRFCMSDGRVLTGPATTSAPRYDVRIRNGQVEVKRINEQ